MSEITHARRRLLLWTAAWAGGLVGAAAVRPARAFQVEEMTPTGAVGRAYAQRCGCASENASLVDCLLGQLAGDP